MKTFFATILLFCIELWGIQLQGQILVPSGIRLKRITFLTSNIDSLTRSFIKKGYNIKQGKREPGGILNNSIIFPNGCEIVLETTLSSDINDWRLQALKKFGGHISSVAFEVDRLHELEDLLRSHNISTTSFGQDAFALDSCIPIDVVFISKDTSSHSDLPDTLSHHPNHVFRFDWVLLSAGSAIEEKLRMLFDIVHARKLHEGCCDFWRLGPSNDFCFFRFEPTPPKAKGSKSWISVESENIYFAY